MVFNSIDEKIPGGQKNIKILTYLLECLALDIMIRYYSLSRLFSYRL